MAFDPSQEIHYVYRRALFRDLMDRSTYFFGNEAEIAKAKTVVWNGPMGAFETPPFDVATASYVLWSVFSTFPAPLRETVH